MRRLPHLSITLRRLACFTLVIVSLAAGCDRFHNQTTTTAEAANPHSATMSWTASASPVAGYNVYRVSPPGGPVKLTPKIITRTEYTDRTVEAGHTYMYFITSVDSHGVESSPSGKVTVTVPANVTPPAK